MCPYKLKLFTLSLLIVMSPRLGAQWIQTESSVTRANWIAGTETNLFAATLNGIFRTTNAGQSWIQAGLRDTAVWSVAIKGSKVFAGTADKGVLVSSDNGNSWTSPYVDSPSSAMSLAVNGNNIFAGGTYGLYVTTNEGASWSQIGVPPQTPIGPIIARGSNIFVALAIGTNAIVSADSGVTWSPILGFPDIPAAFTCLSADIGDFYAGSAGGSGIFRSSDYGLTWKSIQGKTLPDGNVSAVAVSRSTVFIGTRIGVYLSHNEGNEWVDTGLPHSQVFALAIIGTNVYAAIAGGVWRRPLAQLTTTANVISDQAPIVFTLDQNYPNPFNSTTTISFSLGSRSNASLKCFDALGREVSVLLFEELPAGRYSRRWEVTGLPSGIYFYRLQAGLFFETKKLVLLK